MGRPFFIMMTRCSPRHPAGLSAVLLILLLAVACSPAATPTAFIPPTAPAPLIEPTFIIHPTQEIVIVESSPVPTIFPTVNPADCSNNLRFVQDLTIPDNTTATLGLTLDKQWLVENSGTCNWNADYRLRNIAGASLGAPSEIMLYPARAGTQATIQISFTTPYAEGVYESGWQAVDPAGNSFGESIYLRIVVQ